MLWDPIEDDGKQLTLTEFKAIMDEAIAQYANDFAAQSNRWTGQRHSFHEWLTAFRGYMSF
jgi:hypothetical protein